VLDLATLAREKLRPLKRVEYDRLVGLGVFDEEKIELIRGVLLEMTPEGPEHSHTISQLTRLLVLAVGDRATVRVQHPLAASEDSEPEPDLALVLPRSYRKEHPKRALLLIEVAKSSLRRDREIKARLYAEAGVPEYWVVLLKKRIVEVYTAPMSGKYTRVKRCGKSVTIALKAFPDIQVPVAEFL
jgi:Uma2 family endonuclease